MRFCTTLQPRDYKPRPKTVHVKIKSGSHFCEPPKTRQQPTFALFCTIIGHVSLTVVFGMGTCVSSRVASPDIIYQIGNNASSYFN